MCFNKIINEYDEDDYEYDDIDNSVSGYGGSEKEERMEEKGYLYDESSDTYIEAEEYYNRQIYREAKHIRNFYELDDVSERYEP